MNQGLAVSFQPRSLHGAMRGRANLALVAGIAALALGAIGVWMFGGAAAGPAPRLSFKTITGERITTRQLEGKVVLVNFWATSCASCVEEMPMLVDTHNKYAPRGYETIAVAMSYDRPDHVVNFAQTRGLPFKVALDVGSVAATAFDDTRVTPTSFLIDRHGRIVKRYVGAPPRDEFHALIEKTLAAG